MFGNERPGPKPLARLVVQSENGSGIVQMAGWISLDQTELFASNGQGVPTGAPAVEGDQPLTTKATGLPVSGIGEQVAPTDRAGVKQPIGSSGSGRDIPFLSPVSVHVGSDYPDGRSGRVGGQGRRHVRQPTAPPTEQAVGPPTSRDKHRRRPVGLTCSDEGGGGQSGRQASRQVGEHGGNARSERSDSA